MNLRHSKDEPIQINTDDFKIEYPKRKPENEIKELIDSSVDDEELFDCYVRSTTE